MNRLPQEMNALNGCVDCKKKEGEERWEWKEEGNEAIQAIHFDENLDGN